MTFQRVDLAALAAEGVTEPLPTLLETDEGNALLYLGAVNGFHGPDGDGKSELAALAIMQTIRAGATAAVIDYADSPARWISRFVRFGATPDDLAAINYLAGSDPFPVKQIASLSGHVLVVIDSVDEALVAGGLSARDDRAVADWYRQVPAAIARLGPAALVLDHTVAHIDRKELWPYGSDAKRFAISGAAWVLRSGFGRTVDGFDGTATVICARDRRGTYQRGHEFKTTAVLLAAEADDEGGAE